MKEKLKKKQHLIVIIAVNILLIASVFAIRELVLKQNSTWLIIIFIVIAAYAIGIIVCAVTEICIVQIDKIIESKSKEYDPKDIYLLTTEIISFYNDGTGVGPRYITECYLAIKKNENFYELFSRVKIEKEEDTHEDGFCCKNFNTPYIVDVKPLIDHVRDSEKKLTVDLLFAFITEVNTDNRLAQEYAAAEEDDDDENSGEED